MNFGISIRWHQNFLTFFFVEAVLEFLAESPQALSVDLSKICWRFHDNPDFYDQV